MKNIYIKPLNEQKMNEIYVFLSVDKDGNEGIIAKTMNGVSMPFVFGHKRLLKPSIELAKEIAKESGTKIKVYKFKRGDLLETLDYVN